MKTKYYIQFVLLITVFYSCKQAVSKEFGSEDETIEIKDMPPTEISVELAQLGSFNMELVSNGMLEAWKKAELKFETTKKINNIHRTNGEQVKENEVIASLENFEHKNSLEKAQLNFKSIEIALKDLLIGLGYKNGDEVPTDILENAHIKSGYLKAKNDLELASFKYDQTMLKAPFAGSIANLNTLENNYPPQGAFCTLINDSKFYVRFPVMESEQGLIRLNEKVRFKSYFNEDIDVIGRITNINPMINEKGLIEVTALVDKQFPEMMHGMKMKVFVRKPVKNKIFVKKEAVVLRSEKPVIFTYKNGAAQWNYVKTGLENYEFICIEDGISAGDSVIVSGNVHLGHDAPVVIK